MTSTTLTQTGKEIMDSTTAALSGVAVTSPAWLPYLEASSSVAALLMPLLGVTWLAVQIVHKTKEIIKK